MAITIAILRAAGASAAFIARVVELEKQEFAMNSRESSRLRSLRYREAKKAKQINGHVTFQNVTPVIDAPLKESFFLSSTEESLKKPTLVKGRGTRLPCDWTPSSADIEFARGQIAEAWHLERDKFRDYWHGKAGAGATKTDWSATWRNWVRKAAEDRAQPKRVNGYDPDRNTRYTPDPTFWDERPKPP